MKHEIKVGKSIQTAVPEIGKKEKTNYYMVIGDEKGVLTLNIGEATYNFIKKKENENNESNNDEQKASTNRVATKGTKR